MNQATLPTTQNPDFGFWGTLYEQAEHAWPIAIKIISDTTQQPPESVRAFLDSRLGRHFADDIVNFLNTNTPLDRAIQQATQRWMAWRVDRRTRRQHRMPANLPYLTACVILSEQCAD